MSTFKIGEKVVCVDDRIGKTSKKKCLLKGDIYTISRFHKSGGVFLLEIPSVKHDGVDCLPYYNTDRFRKLDYQFAENLLAELTQSAKSEYQLN